MFLFRKLSCHFRDRKLSYLILLVLVFLGFLAGCFYVNLISVAEFTQASANAEQFINQAKSNEISFRLMLSEELSPFLFIALFSLFLAGIFPSVFLIFKWGFSSGFFLTFLIKSFFLKGFFLGGFFLILNLLFFLPALILLSEQSIRLNRFISACVFYRASPNKTIAEELTRMTAATLVTILIVSLGVLLKFLLLRPLCSYLFL